MASDFMIRALEGYLAAAENNLVRYRAMGDERAIRAGEGMVAGFRAELAAARASV